MPDLPRGPDVSSARSAWDIFVIGGVEALTNALRQGRPIRDVDELVKLRARLDAFNGALEARLSVHRMEGLLDETE